MQKAEAERLQARLGVAVDGAIGRGTFAALFKAFGAGPERARELAIGAAVHVPAAGILDTPLRLAHFIAQVAHESGGFRYMEEIASGAAYEGRADLGNVNAGDGVRFKGRGPIQLTGRANYRRFGHLCGIDLEGYPQIAAIPSIGMLTACLYWSEHKINMPADHDDVRTVTIRINGGLNGFDDRKRHLAKAKGLML
jgi:putative chitinase